MVTIQSLLEPRLRKNIDYWLILAVLLLMSISLAAIYGASVHEVNGRMTVIRQALFFGVGIVLMLFMASRDYVKVSRYSIFIYVGNLILLLAVLVFAREVNHSGRWLKIPIPGMDFKLQPSEFAKIATIITLATYVNGMGGKITQPIYLLRSLGHIAPPVVLIMAQKDLGTSLVLVGIWLGIVWLAGAKWQHLLYSAVAGIAIFTIAWYGNILLPYQKARVMTLINPSADTKKKGYHVTQSQIAIGSGSVVGEGLGQGLMTNGSFVPEDNTDFIFSVIGEEGGFVTACLLLAAYGLLLYRGVVTILQSEDGLGRLMAGGIVSLFAFHVTVNIGMTCGLIPVVGIPLPLISMGGSSAWANLISIGLLMSIYIRRHKIFF